MENQEEKRSKLGLDRITFNDRLAHMKIAIIDNGFLGYDKELNLPQSTKVVLQYNSKFIETFGLGDPNAQEPPLQTSHGLLMARIVWEMTGASARGPQLYLLNANGLMNFRRAVRFAIEEKVDIILYSQNRECCGNFDGGGFLNAIVNQAVDAGILWVNAAGNYGGNVYNGAIKGGNSTFHIQSALDENPAQLILTWNSSGSEEATGTDKDLDLFLYDESGKMVAKSDLKQRLHKDKLDDDETFLPRERIRFEFSKNRTGNYRAVIRAVRGNFTARDRFRLVIIPEKQPIFNEQTGKMVRAVSLKEAQRGWEIMTPADNPGVITVGDSTTFSAVGPTMDGRLKPEIVLEDSSVSLSNGESSAGTSVAAAHFTAVLATLRSVYPTLSRDEIIAFPKKQSSLPVVQKIPIDEFGQMHGAILALIEAEESLIQAGRYKDGRYVLGTRQAPQEILSSLCGKTDKQGIEFYLALELATGNIHCFLRRTGTRDRYPWEYKTGDRRSFVEIRQVTSLPFGTVDLRNLWETPLPQNLRRR